MDEETGAVGESPPYPPDSSINGGKIPQACDKCRQSKRKCTGGPLCTRCAKKNLVCTFLLERGRKKKKNGKTKQKTPNKRIKTDVQTPTVSGQEITVSSNDPYLTPSLFNSGNITASDLEAAYKLIQSFQSENTNLNLLDYSIDGMDNSLYPDPLYDLLFANPTMEISFSVESTFLSSPPILKVPPDLFNKWLDFFFNAQLPQIPFFLRSCLFTREEITPPWHGMEYQLLACLVCMVSARAMSQWEYVERLEAQARIEASTLFDTPTRQSMTAFCMFAGFYMAWQPRKAIYYAKLAMVQGQELTHRTNRNSLAEKFITMIQLICCMILMIDNPTQQQLASIAVILEQISSRELVKRTLSMGPQAPLLPFPSSNAELTSRSAPEDLILGVLAVIAELKRDLTQELHRQGLELQQVSKLVLSSDIALDLLTKCDTMYSIFLRFDGIGRLISEFFVGSFKAMIYWATNRKIIAEHHIVNTARLMISNANELPTFLPPSVLEILDSLKNIARDAENGEMVFLLDQVYNIFQERTRIPNKPKISELEDDAAIKFWLS